MPDQEGVNIAASNGQLEILKWMKEKNLLLPNEEGARLAFQNHKSEVVKWLASQNPPVLPK